MQDLTPLLQVLSGISERLAELVQGQVQGEVPVDTALFHSFAAFRFMVTGRRSFTISGITHPDDVDFSQLCGIGQIIADVRRNTERFLQGLPSQNVLLWGPRGTGKSSCIKALLTEYRHRGLRMIEADRDDLLCIPALYSRLRKEPFRFIIFCDDLSFERNGMSPTKLKAVLEGGLEKKPDNVLIHATSNRRHLMPETMADNLPVLEGSGELHPGDALEEKVSLSDRFGLRLGFSRFTQETYLEIVNNYARLRSLDKEQAEFTRAALQWSIEHGGFSGRAARQFIDNL